MSYQATRSKGIYKTGSGSYRFRKIINGNKISRTFPKFKMALEFKNQVNESN